ncbi:O-fucosyltransferase family protein [Rhodoferax antarcticus]|uniref:hypothetical protein n=1 Tax=Rhodoferax antarcticus TaxID=81479 RepID=UPI0022245589|nr:hypothetical protein [Rhodoferax antarcticus]MCW2314239.1 hypothetical protein [Rhodoferax antarcticus]
MIFHTPKLYIDEFVGVSNRFETLPLAFAIQKAYGHEIILDWHELDSFMVGGTKRGKVGMLARLGAQRIRQCDRALFDTLGDKKVILRSLDGPDELLNPIYLETARRIKLTSPLAESIRRSFAKLKGRPVVGVHVRHGDYELGDENIYRVDREWPAVPIWWYAQTMLAIKKVQPNVAFFLSSTGDPRAFRELYEGFDVISLDALSPYTYKGADHASTVNPVADMFALGCCPVILATPISGYSHWAANVFGSASDCIVPMSEATRDDPRRGLVRLYGARLPRWRAAGYTGSDTLALGGQFADIDFGRSADLKWL